MEVHAFETFLIPTKQPITRVHVRLYKTALSFQLFTLLARRLETEWKKV